MAHRVAIIGAGMAGLGAAYALRHAEAAGDDIEVEVFEKSRGFSGRATTRRKHGAHYDHGANYFKTESERIRHLILDALPTDELAQIERSVWTFNASGRIRPGDPDHNAVPKWTYRPGISYLGKLLAEAAAPQAIHTETRIASLSPVSGRGGMQWQLHTTEQAVHGPYDAVVLTPPGPQTTELLEASEMQLLLRQRLVEALSTASYQSQFALMFAFEQPVPRPGADCYALLNLDRRHPIAWLGYEEDKPGHVPETIETLLVAQMSPVWTEAHYDASPEVLSEKGLALIASLLDVHLAEPVWTDKQRWRYALPTEAADGEALKAGHPHGLFIAGDALVGKGRVHLALETGLEAGDVVAEHLAGR